MHVERRENHRIGVKSVSIAISFLSFVQSDTWAQSYPIYNGNPIVGGSTLDLIKPPKGDKLDFQFPTGFNCKIESGDVPSLVMYGDKGGIDHNLYGLSGSRAGVAFVLPLYRSRKDMCDKAVKTQNMQDSLDLAEKLVTSGAMTNEEYLELARKIKRELLLKEWKAPPT